MITAEQEKNVIISFLLKEHKKWELAAKRRGTESGVFNYYSQAFRIAAGAIFDDEHWHALEEPKDET